MTSSTNIVMAKDDSMVSNNSNIANTTSKSFTKTKNKNKPKNTQARMANPPVDLNFQIDTQIKQNKKKTFNKKNQISANHLLQFQSYRDSDEYHTNRSKPRKHNKLINEYQKPRIQLKGMKFINVNYKFVVDNRKQYRLQQLDPNVPFDIEDIIRIIVPRGNACPICLTDDPIAPRMITSCGHLICLKCVLLLLSSEVPKAKKRESEVIVEKYRECPLCSSVIRKHELKPVLINNVDEQFELPKVHHDTVLTLMKRQQDKIISLPKSMDNFDSSDYDSDFVDVAKLNEFLSYSRIFKGSSHYLLDMYNKEKDQILQAHNEEKLLYGSDDFSLVKATLDHIDDEIDHWTNKLAQDPPPAPTLIPSSTPTPPSDATYHYYQTGFNSSCTYVLSPLDMKVLKTTYGSYDNLPSSIVAKIENIKYEELSQETSLSKYKYLSHLPIGSQIGFLECNWFGNQYISHEAWQTFKEDLLKRTKNSQRKFKKEERDRKRAINEEEIRTRKFYEQENRDVERHESSGYSGVLGGVGALSIVDNRQTAEQPPLLSNSPTDVVIPEESFQTTVWGTKIPKPEPSASPVHEDDEDDWDAEEMIRRAKEEMSKQQGGKKKKKKMILLSSNNW
ncbi:uncharacterized protein SPAPADRAFT_155826 [Spathaspora passalidarum NRRL Y-27907]|uniref:RING-type domain-containing protein n=1 Tax=Spathaspora passalidarum (strain NRRL Y-27907 / 11-Y1) TaxID=619300 RepID=G3ASL1_SPAPN|nr:uncharacterized protein SPAPADRAFT_155826 [Spathaspora passalidarum NRRL Y-27907]EGW30697.1 hypothetical protein SPAPADRAFT_155826 [Spathaspora passalidarum NRRL Y-27907]